MTNKTKTIKEETTSFADLERYMRGSLCKLPDFAEGQPFYAKLKRPSMIALARAKKIPNELLSTANQLFATGVNFNNEKAMDDIYGVFDVICDACFVEPTWQELKDHDIALTDEQYTAVFDYSQKGVKALEPFRKQPKDNKLDNDVKNVQQDAVGVAKD